MFRAISRYFRAIGYLFTGRIDSARKVLSENPDVVRATFDRVIQEKKQRISQYKQAVGAMIAQEEKKKSQLKQLTKDVVRLKSLRDGAAAMARKVVDRHGGNVDAVKEDPEYLKCQAAYKDFTNTLQEKESHCVDLEEDIATFQENISGHKVQLQALLRDIEKLKQEKHETVAEMITAKEEREIADMITGISQDRTGEEIQELRDIRDEAKATAKISREMAGLDAKRSEEEFLDFANKTAANSEFDALIGLAKEQDSSEPDEDAGDRTRIPEA